MPLQISAFKGFALTGRAGGVLQVPDGAPVDVTATTFTGVYTVPAGCYMVRVNGTSGTVTWPGVATAESFTAPEYRGVRPGDTFTVA